MDYAKIAYNKVCDLERYVTSIDKRIDSKEENTVVFKLFSENLFMLDNVYDFDVSTTNDTKLVIDVFGVVSSHSGTLVSELYFNDVLVDTNSVATNGENTVFRLVSTAIAEFGLNTIAVNFACNSSAKLTSLVVVVRGLHLEDTSVSKLYAISTAQGYQIVECKANSIFLLSENLSTRFPIRTMDNTINNVVATTIEGRNMCYITIDGVLYSMQLSQTSFVSRLANSVTDMCIVNIGGSFVMYVVVRNRIYYFDLNSSTTKAHLVATSLCKEEKVVKILSLVHLGKPQIVVETKNKIRLFDINDKNSFTELFTNTASAVKTVFNDADKFSYITINNGIAKRHTVSNKTYDSNYTEISTIGRCDSIFQYKQDTAVASCNNQLSTINFK